MKLARNATWSAVSQQGLGQQTQADMQYITGNSKVH